MYKPPFTVSSNAIRMEQGDSLRLRRANRIKTIHSSLAIEGNTLSEGEVQAVLEGKTVVAPLCHAGRTMPFKGTLLQSIPRTKSF